MLPHTIMENISEEYFNLIKDSTKPHVVLVEFYCKVFNVNYSNDLFSDIGRLVKLYGRDKVFFSILDMSVMSDIKDKNKPYPLLNHFCMKYFDNLYHTQKIIDIDLLEKRISHKEEFKTEGVKFE